jgi:UDP-GlcNAc:undecaprenyl-phosphate/decaprenyl-phosphate GlcNAc-1-phosphate transferase
MNYSITQYLLLGLLTLIFVGVITAPLRKLALKVGAVDVPNLPRKIQTEPVPYLGGVAIALGVVVASFAGILVEDYSIINFKIASTVIIPALLIASVGLWDDLKELQPWPRLIAQTSVGTAMAIILIATDTMGFALGNQFLNAAVSIFWIVGITNSINFFDNLDGGAAGTVAIASFFLFLIANSEGQILVSALAIVVCGSTAGFLLWNKSPAKIYMGDAGALFLGIIMGVLTIRLDPGITPKYLSLLIPIALLAIPILDTTVAVVSRLYRGISPFTGGRDHLSHRLMRIGMHRKYAAITLWAASGVYGLLAYAIYQSQNSLFAYIAGAGWVALLVFFLRVPSEDK